MCIDSLIYSYFVEQDVITIINTEPYFTECRMLDIFYGDPNILNNRTTIWMTDFHQFLPDDLALG